MIKFFWLHYSSVSYCDCWSWRFWCHQNEVRTMVLWTETKINILGVSWQFTVHFTQRDLMQRCTCYTRLMAVSTVCLSVSPVLWASLPCCRLIKKGCSRTYNGVGTDRIRGTVNEVERSTKEQNTSVFCFQLHSGDRLWSMVSWFIRALSFSDLPRLHRSHETRSRESACWNFRGSQRRKPLGRRGTGIVKQANSPLKN